ncbi:MAG TPA: HAD-IA family hydrolase [Actinomycetota bacterium]|jgi:2-haloacid dehalogenase|nr:HAD-IA family hydrolase [Actinomycetota bacterium]
MSERWATFDCYGTLIDWLGGIRMTLSELFPEHDAELLLGAYHEIEPEVQRGRSISYRQVLSETLERLAHREGLELAADDRAALAESLPTWPPFPEVPPALDELRHRGWRIAILSNTDPDLLDASLSLISVPVDARITAAEAGSYKPSPGHWETFFERTGADRDRHAHVAASLFHDIEPCAAMGLRSIWINRLGESSQLSRAAELPDLDDLPDTLDRLVPA